MHSPVVPAAGAAAAASGQGVGLINRKSKAFALDHVSVVDVSVFTKDILYDLFNLAEHYAHCRANDQPVDHVLKGKTMGQLFYEASTRTSSSFEVAMQRLGGGVTNLEESKSSARKGETLEDTVKVMSGYADVLVVRHPRPGAVKAAALAAAAYKHKPVINAGDGEGEHPTQALVDVFTIRSEIGTVKNRTVTLVGDLKYGRTVHSLARLLALYEGVRLRYVCPAGLGMPADVRTYVSARGVPQADFATLEEAVPDTDVLYVTRVQRERFPSEAEYEAACRDYVVDVRTLLHAKPNVVVMHPLPRVAEIAVELDSDPRAAYFRQAENGLYVRMALLAMIIGKA